MTLPVLDPVFAFRLLRDHAYEALGYYPLRPEQLRTRYLWQHSLALECTAFGGMPYVMWGTQNRPALFDLASYRKLAPGDSVFLRIEDLARWNREILPNLAGPDTLLTGESDYTIPNDFPREVEHALQSGMITRWLATNYDQSSYGDRLIGLPIGIKYAKKNDLQLDNRVTHNGPMRTDMCSPAAHEARWHALFSAAKPVHERIVKVFSDCHLNDTAKSRRYGQSRTDIREQLRHNPVLSWLPKRVHHFELLARYAQHAFVLSPHGRGLDCHRTWEALHAGAIPIVKTSPLDHLYRGLPVAIVQDYRELDARRLQCWLDEFGLGFDRSLLQRTLRTEHWSRRLREGSPGGHSAPM